MLMKLKLLKSKSQSHHVTCHMIHGDAHHPSEHRPFSGWSSQAGSVKDDACRLQACWSCCSCSLSRKQGEKSSFQWRIDALLLRVATNHCFTVSPHYVFHCHSRNHDLSLLLLLSLGCWREIIARSVTALTNSCWNWRFCCSCASISLCSWLSKKRIRHSPAIYGTLSYHHH